MKQNLGRILGLILLLIASLVYADEPYKWSLYSNKESVYVNEAVAVEYTCEFKDQGYLHVIELDIEGENDGYRLLSRGVNETVVNGKRRDTYRYTLFPKREGEQELRFKVLMRKTTKASIENSVIGRDNVEDYAFIDKTVELPPLHLDVSAHQERITGRFELEVKLDRKEVNAYEPVHLDVKVNGEGNFDEMRDISLHIDGVKIFSEPGEDHYSLTADGFKGTWEQKFSIVAKEDFVIEPIELSYFDISKKRKVTLRSERFSVKVNAGYMAEELLDDVPGETDGSWWSWSYLNYFFTLLSGVVLGRYSLRLRSVKKRQGGFMEEVEACHSVKMLLSKLVMTGDVRFSPLITQYEALGNKASLTALKREVKVLLKSD